MRRCTTRYADAHRRHTHVAPARARTRAWCEPVRLLARAGAPPAGLPPLLPTRPPGPRAHPGGGAGDHGREPPVVPRPVRHRHDDPPADLLRRKARALREPLRGLVPERTR